MNIPTPRKHQKEGLMFFARCLKKPGYYLRQAPTGTGKSLELRLFLYLAMSHGFRAIVSSVSDVVCNRFMLDISKETHNKIKPSDKFESVFCKGMVPVITHQMLWRRIEALYEKLGEEAFNRLFHNVILLSDEAHHLGLEAERNRNAAKKLKRIIATTATPWPNGITRESTQSYIGDGLFSNVLRYTITEAISDIPPTLCNYVLHDEIPDYNREIGKTIWFYRNMDSITANFKKHKRRVAILHSDIVKRDKEAKGKILSAFEKGAITDILTCRMVSEGVDLVSAQNVVYEDEFASHVFLVQSFGRVLRIYGNKIAHAYGNHSTINNLRLGISR